MRHVSLPVWCPNSRSMTFKALTPRHFRFISLYFKTRGNSAFRKDPRIASQLQLCRAGHSPTLEGLLSLGESLVVYRMDLSSPANSMPCTSGMISMDVPVGKHDATSPSLDPSAVGFYYIAPVVQRSCTQYLHADHQHRRCTSLNPALSPTCTPRSAAISRSSSGTASFMCCFHFCHNRC